MIYRLRDAGVRVPEPMNFVEGVLVMELVKDTDGDAAPRLADLDYTPAEAKAVYDQLIREVVRMLSAGVIHGDLSEFNVLMAGDGPVVIDFPQSIDPTHNPNGEKLLLRDVENLHRFLSRYAPEEEIRPYGQEIWKLFQTNKLRPDTKLTGVFAAPEGKVDTTELIDLIEDATKDEARRRAGPKLLRDDDDEFEAARDALAAKPPTFRKVVDFSKERPSRPAARKQRGKPEGKQQGKQNGAAEGGQKSAPQRRRSRTGGNAPARSETAPPAPARPGRPKRNSRPKPSGDRPNANEKASFQKTPPRGPKAMMDNETPPAGEGAGANRSDAPRRRRNRRRRGGTPKPAREQGNRSESSSARPAHPSSARSRPKAETPKTGSATTNESNRPRTRRRSRTRRPGDKPDAD